MSCDFSVDARIIAADETTVRISMQDEAAGYKIIGDLGEPEWDEDDSPASSPYMHGDAPSRLPTIVAGFLPVVVACSGPTWPSAQARRGTLWTAWRAEPSFFLETEIEGVTTRYRARRSLWRPEPITSSVIMRKRQEVALVFRVQPFPTVTYA